MRTLEMTIYLVCLVGTMFVLDHYIKRGKITVWYRVIAGVIFIGIYLYLAYVVHGDPFVFVP